MKKRVLFIFSVMALCIAITGCGSENTDNSETTGTETTAGTIEEITEAPAQTTAEETVQ